LIATALDASFRRVEAETSALLLRPLWRLAAAKRIWNRWTEQVPKVKRLREDEAVLDSHGEMETDAADDAKDVMETKVTKAVQVESKNSQGKKASKKTSLQEWSRRSLAMLNEMGCCGIREASI